MKNKIRYRETYDSPEIDSTFEELPIEEENILRVKDLIKELERCNPEAIIVSEYDGHCYGIGEIHPTKLRSFWGSTEHTSYHITVYSDDDYPYVKKVDPKKATAIFFE